VAGAAKVAHDVHGAVLTGVYGSIRLVNRAVGEVLTTVIEESTKPDRE
jgi:hypothetical protein